MKAKTASVIFGLVTAAASVAQADPQKAPTPPVTRSLDAAVHALLRAPLLVHAIQLMVAKPLVDENDDFVCGNVMSKGGPHHVCHLRKDLSAEETVKRVIEGAE